MKTLCLGFITIAVLVGLTDVPAATVRPDYDVSDPPTDEALLLWEFDAGA